MTAQIRPNRMEVSDRFPMLGFAVRTDQPDVEAEVVIASDVGLFNPQRRTARTAANFYSSREHGSLRVPRGEGVFVVPPEVLARFIGNEKLFFGLATGHSGNGGLQVDALPREGSPYVSLRGFTGRTLRRGFGAAPATTPKLDWTGDGAKPGSEATNGAAPTTPTQPSTAPSGAPYDDGFGPMPDIPARESAFRSRAQEADPNHVPPALPDNPRERARRIGGEFAPRIGEALDMGLDPASLTSLLDKLDSPLFATPQSYGASNGHDQARLARAPQPRVRAMDGGAGVAIAVASLIISQLASSQGDVTWTLDQLRNVKHPNNIVPNPIPPMRDAPTIRLDDWPVAGGLVDDISAWFSIDWQCNGQSLGNVRIANIGVNDAVGWGLKVTAQIMDDDIIYAGGMAALRIRFSYQFDRTIGSEVLAYREVHLFGDGTHSITGDWIQASALAVPDEPRLARPPQPRARAMEGNAGGSGNAGNAVKIAGIIINQLSSAQGDVTWNLEQGRGLKHPNGVAPSPLPPLRDAPTIRLDDWPVAGGLVDDISAWFSVDWQCNGQSLGNVRIANIGVNDAVGWGLNVSAEIMDDAIVYSNNRAALRIRFSYRFDRTIGSEVLAYRELHLYGDGTYDISGDWIQASALSAPEEPRLTPAPQPRARAMDGGAGVAIAVAELVISQLASSQGDVTWTLDQLRNVKHPNNIVPNPIPPMRDAPTIRLDDWPVAGGLVDDISAWFSIDWQCNGQSLGNVRIANIGVNDAVGWGLKVTAQIMDDDIIYAGGMAALRIRFSYQFDRTIGSEVLAYREVHLFGDGTHSISGDWIQASALSHATVH